MRGPTAQPICPPARGQSGVQQRQADRPGRIDLLDLGYFLAGFGCADHRDAELAVKELFAGLGDLVFGQALGRGAGFGLMAQTLRGGARDHDEAPWLQLAMIGRACARAQNLVQLRGVGGRGHQRLGRARATRQQKIKRGLIAFGGVHVLGLGHWPLHLSGLDIGRGGADCNRACRPFLPAHAQGL